MKTPWRFVHIVLTLALIAVPSLLTGEQKIRFARLGIDQGLSQNAVNCIFQDSQGFMWFGTQDGLNRFDGHAIKVFKNDAAVPGSISDNFIFTIGEDSAGTLWVGTQGHPDELNRFDRAGETFSLVPESSVTLRRDRTSSVLATTTDRSGNIWTGSIGGGLVRVNPATGDTTRFRHKPGVGGTLSSNRVYSVYCDRSGTVWAGTASGLNRFDPATTTFTVYRNRPGDPRSLSSDWVWPILEDASGILWVGTVNNGLNRFDRTTERFTRYTHDEANPTSLSHDYVLSLYEDRSGLLWVGTANAGLNTFHPRLNPFEIYTHHPDDPSSLIDNTVMSLRFTRDGGFWAGTTGGLSRLDRAKGTFTHLTHRAGDPRTIAENTVSVLLEDKAGAIWAGTFSSGLDRIDPLTGNITHFRHSAADSFSLSDNRVYALLEDRYGALWVGTYGGGLNRLDRNTGRFTVYRHKSKVPETISAMGAWALLEDRDGVLWIGTFGGGLNRFDRKTETFKAFRNDPGDPASISDDMVLTLFQDGSGTIWAGTASGLNRFDRKTGTFTRYGEREGLPNATVLGVLGDSRGVLWLSTNKGLCRFDPAANTFKTYDARDGLQGDEFNQNAYAMNPLTGEMAFGGPKGFNIFHPDSVSDNPFVPPVVFSAFRRYNTDDEEGIPIEERGIAAASSVTLSYKDNIVTFEFAALSFLNPAKNRYAYQLEGFSNNWIQLGTDHRATFTNLDPGEYTLRIRGSNNDGVWNTRGSSLSLTVTPPWWRTTWAYILYGLLTLAALIVFRNFELRQQAQKALIRESELRAKAAEAENRALEAENERKTKELEEARNLQLSMLPQDVPRLPHLEIAVFMRTATEVGGDYYDFHLEGDTLNVAFGDATGHGMQAGTIVTLMKGLFTSDAARLEIDTFFNHCSKSIKGIRLGRLLMAFSLLRITGNKLCFSSAGMPPMFIHRRDTNRVDEVLLKGMPLGAMKKFPYTIWEGSLDPGDAALLVSDGLPEQKNKGGEMFDYPRLQEIFRDTASLTPEEIIRRLVDAGDSWMDGASQDDDITLLIVRRREAA